MSNEKHYPLHPNATHPPVMTCEIPLEEYESLKRENAELKAENHRLKRALWISRAKAYHYIAELLTCFNPEFIRNRRMFTPNNLKQKQMDSLAWAHLMLGVERKCRAKAEEYK